MAPATAATWYSPAGTSRRAPPQPGDEVLRSQETCSTVGTPRVSTTTLDPPPLAQSAELQMRRPASAMTTATNWVPMLKRHGRACPETALTVKCGVAPGWYQYCGDERLSVTWPGAQAGSGPEAGDAATRWRRFGAALGRAEGDRRADARSVWACAGAEPAEFVTAGPVARRAAERAASTPFAAQLMVASSPMPTARTVTRRRQYVAGEILAGGRRGPRGWPGLPRGR